MSQLFSVFFLLFALLFPLYVFSSFTICFILPHNHFSHVYFFFLFFFFFFNFPLFIPPYIVISSRDQFPLDLKNILDKSNQHSVEKLSQPRAAPEPEEEEQEDPNEQEQQQEQENEEEHEQEQEPSVLPQQSSNSSSHTSSATTAKKTQTAEKNTNETGDKQLKDPVAAVAESAVKKKNQKITQHDEEQSTLAPAPVVTASKLEKSARGSKRKMSDPTSTQFDNLTGKRKLCDTLLE